MIRLASLISSCIIELASFMNASLLLDEFLLGLLTLFDKVVEESLIHVCLIRGILSDKNGLHAELVEPLKVVGTGLSLWLAFRLAPSSAVNLAARWGSCKAISTTIIH